MTIGHTRSVDLGSHGQGWLNWSVLADAFGDWVKPPSLITKMLPWDRCLSSRTCLMDTEHKT